MKTIGIKLADGSFFPVLQEGQPEQKQLELTTAHNNQTRVMVDLYRSESGSMDDAEYVDTLQIDNIKEHPRGESNIAFSVAIDENNELSANIVDEETGAESKTTIELVNRTLEERMADEPSDYDIAETSVDESEVLSEDFGSEEAAETEEKPADDKAAAAGVAAGGGLLAAAMLLSQKEDEANEEVPEEPAVDFAEETVAEEEPVVDFAEETVTEEEPVADFAEESVAEEEPAVDFAEETVTEEEPFADFSLDDLENEAEGNEETDFLAEETISDESSENDVTSSDFDLPDFNNLESEETISDNDFETTESESLFDLPDFEEENTAASSVVQDTDMDWDFDEELTRAENSSSSEMGSDGLSFTGLYDKETELGESSFDDSDYESDKKKTRTSVIICIICAIICIIAVLLVLFVIPSKLNVLKKGQKNEAPVEITEPVKPEPVAQPAVEPEPEPEVPSAKEDEIVIIEEAEEVKPEPPAPPKVEPKQDIIYKIKWGDTLWDIADTYYKNPWRYKKIARYNGIKDPDYIISGTKIRIPQE